MRGQRTRELELRTREADWMQARARDRRSWPTPAAWAKALLKLAEHALVRAQAQVRLLGSDHRELFALMANVERIADDRFSVTCGGQLIYVVGPRRSDDPRPAVIAKAARLADVERSMLLAAADQQETVIRRRRRSHRRGLELAEGYIARPKAGKAAKVSPRAAAAPASRPSRSARLFESCGGGWFVFVGVEGESLEIDYEEYFSAFPDRLFDPGEAEVGP